MTNLDPKHLDAQVADLQKRANAFGMLLSDPPKVHPAAIALREAADTITALRAQIDRERTARRAMHRRAQAAEGKLAKLTWWFSGLIELAKHEPSKAWAMGHAKSALRFVKPHTYAMWKMNSDIFKTYTRWWERAAAIEAAALACEGEMADNQHDSSPIMAFLGAKRCRDRIRALHTDATRAAMDAIRREAGAELQKALEYYADISGDGYTVDVYDYGWTIERGHIIIDGGKIARTALGAVNLCPESTSQTLSMDDVKALKQDGELICRPDAPKTDLPDGFWDEAGVRHPKR